MRVPRWKSFELAPTLCSWQLASRSLWPLAQSYLNKVIRPFWTQRGYIMWKLFTLEWQALFLVPWSQDLNNVRKKRKYEGMVVARFRFSQVSDGWCTQSALFWISGYWKYLVSSRHSWYDRSRNSWYNRSRNSWYDRSGWSGRCGRCGGSRGLPKTRAGTAHSKKPVAHRAPSFKASRCL